MRPFYHARVNYFPLTVTSARRFKKHEAVQIFHQNASDRKIHMNHIINQHVCLRRNQIFSNHTCSKHIYYALHQQGYLLSMKRRGFHLKDSVLLVFGK